MYEHRFSSRYVNRCHFCGIKAGHQPGGGKMILVRRKVGGKHVHVCKGCLISKRALIDYS